MCEDSGVKNKGKNVERQGQDKEGDGDSELITVANKSEDWWEEKGIQSKSWRGPFRFGQMVWEQKDGRWRGRWEWTEWED